VAYKKKILLLILALALLAFSVCAEGSYKYYIAGGYVNQDSDAVISMLNPGDTAANTSTTLYFTKNTSKKFERKIAPHSILTFRVSELTKENSYFGAVTTSDVPIMLGHEQYDGTYSAGFGSVASTQPGFISYFGEGYTSGMVKTYLFMLNPSPNAANVGVTLYYENGEKRTFNVAIPSLRQVTIDLKEKTMPEKRFGMKVTSTVPIVVEAANYNKKFSAGTGGLGSDKLSRRWYFADGYVSTDATEFLNIVNPGLSPANINVTFYFIDGTKTAFDDVILPGSKKMFMMNNYIESLKWFSTVVDSDVDIVAERTHYDDEYSAGNGGVGTTDTVTQAYFTNGLVNDNTKNFIAVFNPGDDAALLTLTIIYGDGSDKVLKETAKAGARTTIDLNTLALPDKNFGVYLESSVPIVAEQVTYDKKLSTGFSIAGKDILGPKEEKVAQQDVTAPVEANLQVSSEDEYVLLKTEGIPISRFNESVAVNLEEVDKSTYSYKGNNIITWQFIYIDQKSSTKGLSAALSGKLFRILELTPSIISNSSAHYFVSDKSEGYMVQSGKVFYAFVTEKGQANDSYRLAEMFLAGNPPKSKGPGLTAILLIIAALLVFVILVSIFFRKKGKEETETLDEVTKPKSVTKLKTQKQMQKEPKKKEQHAKHEHKEEKHPAEMKEQKAEKQVQKAEHRQEKHHAEIKEQKAEKHEQKAEHKEEKQEHKESHHKEHKSHKQQRPDITIKEKAETEKTAQDFLDDAEEIPEYEDVFRHVNRDLDEIKPK